MKPQILLVHNRFNFRDLVTYLSYAIRVFTCSKWNHVAIRVGDQVIESAAHGVVATSYPEWEAKTDRIVLPLTPQEEFNSEAVLALKGKSYGHFDLIQIARKIKAEKWDGRTWTGRNYEGYLCSELGAVLLGKEGLISPADFEHMPGLVRGEEYETRKK